MKKILLCPLFLIFLASCAPERPDFKLPSVGTQKNCPILKKGQTIAVARITFEHNSLEISDLDHSIFAEVAEMHRRCGGNILIRGSSIQTARSSEPADYGYLRAGKVFKELEKNRVYYKKMHFEQRNNSSRDVVIFLKR